MQAQYTEFSADAVFYFQDFDDMLESGHERHKKSIKFKQERIFPAHKKSRAHRRKKKLL
jgi:hypothetical protein